MRIRPLLAGLLAAAVPGCASAQQPPVGTPSDAVLETQSSGVTVLLHAVSPVDESVVWVSGQDGTWLRTTDGGATWQSGVVTGARELEFRDVHAASATEAWLLAAGPGDASRVYHTTDAGASWQLQWTNDEPLGFYDCMAFWDARRGVVYGDAVDGELRILRTEDGGRSWRLVPQSGLPAALPGEGGFAASGTCLVTRPGGGAWVAAGNAPTARVFRTEDYGLTWSATEAPVAAGEAAGLTSISMADERMGTAFGGNLQVDDERTDNVVRTTDGGRTWTLMPRLAMLGAAYGGVHVPVTGGQALIAVGPGGADISFDGARSWRTLDGGSWWGIGSLGTSTTWMVGPAGRVARVRLR
jgi:photosystem II stability/assembly factor-like uncharacterized protein